MTPSNMGLKIDLEKNSDHNNMGLEIDWKKTAAITTRNLLLEQEIWLEIV